MENSILNNSNFLDPEEGLKVIGQLFILNLPEYNVKTIYNNGGFYGFGVIVEKDDIEIMFGGERGTFSHKILINSKPYSLYKYDTNMSLVVAASKENYTYAMSILIHFLNDIKRRDNVPFWSF